jgi:hypothetical protein
MDFRLYDNTLGRFFGIDALSEQNHYLSTYNFADGNPVIFSDPTGLDSEYNWSNNYGSHGRFFQTGHYNFRDNNYLAINAGNSGAGGGGSTTPKFKTAQELSDYLMKITPAGRNISYADMGNGQWAEFEWERYVYNPNEPGNAIDNRGGTLNALGFGMRKVFIGHPVAALVGKGNGGGGIFNSFGRFMEKHFFLEAESQLTHGLQVGGIVYKGIGIDASLFHQVLWEGKIGTQGNSSTNYNFENNPTYYKKGKALEINVAKGIGGGFGFNIENGQVVSTTISLGFLGCGGDVTFDSSGITKSFIGFQAGAKLAVIWGVSASGKIGLNFEY